MSSHRAMDKVELDFRDTVTKLAIEASIVSTRKNAVEALVDIFPKVDVEQQGFLIQSVLRKILHDKSDEVRALLAERITKIQENVGYPLMRHLTKFVAGHLSKGGTKVR